MKNVKNTDNLIFVFSLLRYVNTNNFYFLTNLVNFPIYYFRSSIVNNRTQAVVCDDLGITEYALFAVPKKDLKVKDRADLLEAFLGALYVDKDLEYCQVFAAVCFFPR